MDFFGLLCGCGFAGADSPDGLVGDHDLLHIFCGEVEEHVLDLGGYHLEVAASLTLVQVFADAEDYAKAFRKGELGLDDQLFVGFAVVLPALGVTEDGPVAANALKHCHRYFAGVCAGGVVGTVLCCQFHLAALDGICHGGEMGEGSGHDEAYVCRSFGGPCDHLLCKFNSFGDCGVHLPVARNYFLTHFFVF